MRKKTRFLIYPILIMGAFFVVASSCKKEKNEDNSPTPNNTQTFTDSRDGTVYKYVKIGDQYWMAENLKYLPSVVESNFPNEINAYPYTDPYYYVYGYNGRDVNAAKATANYETYGVLYNSVAACSSCPDGWHLPSDAEWEVLINNLGGRSLAGGKLKSKSGWHNNGNGTDEVGFSALPGGIRSSNSFSGIETSGTWRYSSDSWIHIGYENDNSIISLISKSAGLSVRCVRD